MENKRNTWENVRKKLRIKLKTNLPPRGRHNWAMKGNQIQKGSYSREQIVGKDNAHHYVVKKVPFSKGLRSHLVLSDDDFYNTLEMICQEKIVQPHVFSLEDRTSNNLFHLSTNLFMSDYSPKKVRCRHLEPESFNDEKTSGSKFTITDPNENGNLKAQLAEQEAINRGFQKEREEVITKEYEEKKELLR